MEKIPLDWFENFFHGITLDLWRNAIPPEHTAAEAEFLIKQLACAPGAHLLDVPCGNGRLSFELAKHGYRITGVDISDEFISEASALKDRLADPSNGTERTAMLEFNLGDMRRIEGEQIYDGGYCFGNSFGFMPYDDMKQFLAGVARALKPGARFIVNTAMAAESLLPDFEEQSCHEVGDITTTIKERYLATESCVDSEYIFERNGQKEIRRAKHWIYTAAEIQRILAQAGFKVLDCFGSLQGEPYQLGSRELFVVSEKD
jgi:cyclopropane fatty-acyl-phospholipid synthase-like methyltransferase